MDEIDFSKIKIIIWDLDDTFWRGTLSEDKVDIPEQNKKLIIDLTKRGIVNSICSKNDFDAVKQVLVENNIYEYFVFPSVNWEMKGPRIKELISSVKLRDVNVLFIDDNPHNLGEAKEFCPNIMCSGPSIIPQIIEKVGELGKEDSTMSRLYDYKVLEKNIVIKQSIQVN